MNKYFFYDTSALLLRDRFEEEEHIAISSISLQELENIKSSRSKSEEVKYRARKILHAIEEDSDKVEIIIYTCNMMDCILEKDLESSNDMKILATAIWYDNNVHPDETIFVTNDLSLKTIANLFFGSDSIISYKPVEEHYKGYKEVTLSAEELSYFYTNRTDNRYGLLTNEYLIVKEKETGNIVDRVCWNGKEFRHLTFSTFNSLEFGQVRPYKDDIHQLFAFDSFINNQVTMICGKAGTGKTMLAFAYLFSLLGKRAIDKIIVFCNPAVVKDSAQLGLYPGTQIEKLLQTQAGSILSSKLGSQLAVEQLIAQNKLQIVPACDARGYQTPPHSGIYIMESQNLTSDLLRLLLQRIDEDSKVIVDGDFEEQVDNEAYARDNGMLKMSKVFRGDKDYGQVELETIHRSRIAQLADKMK